MAPLSFAIYDNGVRANARSRRASMERKPSGKDVRDGRGGEQRLASTWLASITLWQVCGQQGALERLQLLTTKA